MAITMKVDFHLGVSSSFGTRGEKGVALSAILTRLDANPEGERAGNTPARPLETLTVVGKTPRFTAGDSGSHLEPRPPCQEMFRQ
jgi:hypothetical protein